MTWHLKDRELERKLNDLVGENEFTKALNQACLGIGFRKTIIVKFGPNTGYIKGSFRCYFEEEELTNIGYNPKTWNSYPDVTPPKYTFMRYEDEHLKGYKAKFDGENWTDVSGTVLATKHGLYRPWED